MLTKVVSSYSTAHMQVDGLTWVWMLALKYSRTNTRVEYVSAWHEHNMMVHVMILKLTGWKLWWDETCTSIFQILESLLKKSQFALACDWAVPYLKQTITFSMYLIGETCICHYIHNYTYTYSTCASFNTCNVMTFTYIWQIWYNGACWNIQCKPL